MTTTTSQNPEPVDQTTTLPSAEPAASAVEISPDVPAESVSEPEPVMERDEGVWGDLRSSFHHAHQVLLDWTDDGSADDLKPALDEASRVIAEAAVASGRDDGGLVVGDSRNTASVDQAVRDESPAFVQSVDDAYADAQAAGLATDSLEWTGVSTIRGAIRNLWDTIRAVSGRRWAELFVDIRVMGPLNTLATRAARGIATIAGRAVNRLELRGALRQPGVDSLASLRGAYINARSQVRAHAATHEWQRIAALWGTVNTLARQVGDPGIRAVVARTADAISDHADALSRRLHQAGQAGATRTITDLARAAEHHASALRASTNQALSAGPDVVPAAEVSAGKLATGLVAPQSMDASALQARAHEVARLARARQGQEARADGAVPRGTHGVNVARDQEDQLMRLRSLAPSLQPVRGPRRSM
ncbi:hypothetical protein ABH926_007226 [Catenulispora sp. GP43]|uniref:hypothetical protein n=1 Tax=Catenulispora sp. GP43 TaxID=3156263 RepID=UPI003519AC83